MKRRLKVLPTATLALFTVLLIVIAIIIIYNNRDIPLPVEYREVVETTAFEEGIAEHILYAVIYTESSFDAEAESSVGAMGLMQLLPSTAQWLCEREGAEYDESMLTDPEFNVKYGARYLKILYDRYENWDAAHAAYHAGFTRVDSWLEEGTAVINEEGQLVGIPLESTSNYVNKIREVREKYFKQLEEENNENT
ncbi:MAG: lytic transglycosylase domain-containing protein [Clostridia bacterium]|nr:lytic transglycosylase domain-containing protein [Clostridia bacterium]